jgi:hypothetical protein
MVSRRSLGSTAALIAAAAVAVAVALAIALVIALTNGGSGGRTGGHATRRRPHGAETAARLGFPHLATKNTTRVATENPVSVAAAVALAVFPSAAPGTHPTAITLAPTDDWQAAIAAASLMGAPFRAPILLSPPGRLPHATVAALRQLAPTGAVSLGGVQLIGIGHVPALTHLHSASIEGSSPFALAAAIDAYEAKHRGRYAINVMVVSADAPQYAMPAAGYAAESGEPILFVTPSGVPEATRRALVAHHRPHIFVLGPPSAVPNSVLSQLAHYGPVARIGAADPAANAIAFTEYRDPDCAYGQPCVHVPGSFGWAIRSPGHGYVLLDADATLDAAAASALSSSGSYGPQLLIDDPNTLPQSVLNYFLNYATPGYTGEGPTAAVYNHAWLIGGNNQISVAVQAQVDALLEAVPQQ